MKQSAVTENPSEFKAKKSYLLKKYSDLSLAIEKILEDLPESIQSKSGINYFDRVLVAVRENFQNNATHYSFEDRLRLATQAISSDKLSLYLSECKKVVEKRKAAEDLLLYFFEAIEKAIMTPDLLTEKEKKNLQALLMLARDRLERKPAPEIDAVLTRLGITRI